jgi:uncharacterized membrane protein YkvA (DUF1232 family)
MANELVPSEFSDENFWAKLNKYAQVAGEELVRKVLEFYYALRSPQTPKWAKTVIIGALAYFIMPVDAVPDFIPAAGYTDDLGTLLAALGTVHMYITDDVKRQAQAKWNGWFGKEQSTPGQSV